MSIALDFSIYWAILWLAWGHSFPCRWRQSWLRLLWLCTCIGYGCCAAVFIDMNLGETIDCFWGMALFFKESLNQRWCTRLIGFELENNYGNSVYYQPFCMIRQGIKLGIKPMLRWHKSKQKLYLRSETTGISGSAVGINATATQKHCASQNIGYIERSGLSRTRYWKSKDQWNIESQIYFWSRLQIKIN